MRKSKTKILVIISLVILSLNSFGHQNEIIDSFKADSIIKELVSKEIDSYKFELDSMKNQIEKYKLNENYYTTALSSQTAIFSLIVTVLFLLIGYISYYKFQNEVKQVKQKYNQSIENYKKIEERLSSSDGDLYGSLALIFQKEKIYDHAIYFGLFGLTHASLDNSEKETIISNISALIEWSEDQILIDSMDYLVEKKEDVFQFLNKLTCILDNDIQKEVAKLRISLSDKINNA